MRSLLRSALVVCSLLSLLALSACNTPFAGKTTSTPNEIAVTRCDGSSVARASVSQPPVAAPASLYVGADVGDHPGSGKPGLVALSASDGASRWCLRFALTRTYTCPPDAYCPGPPTALVGMPLVADDVVYVCVSGGAAGVSYAFGASDGALRWSRETGCRIGSIPFNEVAQPILNDGILYSGAYGLAPADGAVRWRLPSLLTQDPIGAVANGVAYVYSQGGVSAVRLTDGAVTWAFKLDAPIGNLPVPFGDHLYVGDIGGNQVPEVIHGLPDTYALDIRTGTVIWRAPTGMVTSTAVVANGLVYISAENTMNALDATTGAFRWRVTLPYVGYIASTPVVTKELVYFIGDGVYAVDAMTGAVRWHNALDWNESTVFAGPTLGDTALYLTRVRGDGNSVLYALDPASGAVHWQRADVNALLSPAV